MTRQFLTISAILVCAMQLAHAQTTKLLKADAVAILKAEDERRYDPAISGILSGRYDETSIIRALLAAGRIGDERAVPALAQKLSSANPKVAAVAAFALGEIESIAAADAILQRIGETERAQIPGQATFDNRGRLAEAAGKIAAANAKDPKAKQLSDAIAFVLAAEKERQTSVETIRLALTAALRARPAGSEENIRFFLSHTDPNVVADALNTLARLRAKNANRDARDLLETNTHAVIRANAARLLGAAEDKEGLEVLLKAASTDSDPRVRVSAIRSLASLKDSRAAVPLLDRAEKLLGEYKASKLSNPVERNELLEISAALGRLLADTRNERAVKFFRDYGTLDNGMSPEIYIARMRVAPGRGDDKKAELTSWRQYSTLAQIIGELADVDTKNEEALRMKAEAPQMLRPLVMAYADADPVAEANTIYAAPDVLRAYAKYKPADLSEVLRKALANRDVFIRAAAAELIGEQPSSAENLAALNKALEYAIVNDKEYNDAVLATLEALFKLDKKAALPALELAAGSPDHLVRAKSYSLLKDEGLKGVELPPLLKNSVRVTQVRPFSGKATKVGQVLNTEADYRRAVSRKNGTVKAVLATDKGTFTIDLLPEESPLTVDNFIKLAKTNYFNGLEVHRVVPNFVMQDGDPRGDGNGGPGWSIRCEINMIPYERGAVGMALSGKDTGGSQWFVTHSPQPHLDGGYTVFGRVNETDMKVVDNIVRGDRILSVRIVESGSKGAR